MAQLAAAEVLDEPLLKLTRKWQVGGGGGPVIVIVGASGSAGAAARAELRQDRAALLLQRSKVVFKTEPKKPNQPQGAPKKYGSAYVMEIKDTVVEGVEGESEGSDEFLVFSSALVKAAAAAGLHPVGGARFGRGAVWVGRVLVGGRGVSLGQ
jgi:hypothetical protein